ncbi:MAG: OadG family protein [Pseudomonadota bacterium]|nr:OadG family protein [Pseudomonadota bacterium]
MAVTGLLMEGLRLMAIGMGIVFAFLLLLVGVLRVMSLAVMRFAPGEPAPASGPVSEAPVTDGELVAVITAAIARYREGRH